MRDEKIGLKLAVNYAEEIRQVAVSLCEDVKDANSMTEAWNKIDKFYQTVEGMRNLQTCTGSKSFSLVTDDICEGHTKYLQGIDLPIMVNTIWKSDNDCIPSEVCEMHIGKVDEKLVLLITPEHISLP